METCCADGLGLTMPQEKHNYFALMVIRGTSMLFIVFVHGLLFHGMTVLDGLVYDRNGVTWKIDMAREIHNTRQKLHTLRCGFRRSEQPSATTFRLPLD
jgi:hypothetical protein